MSIQRVEAAIYGVEDVATAVRYFQDVGLELVEQGKAGARLRTLENQTIEIRDIGDPGLPPAIEPGSTMREAVWGVGAKSDLEAIGSELSKDRDVTVDADGTLHTRDESGFYISFRKSDPKPVAVRAQSLNAGTTIGRLNLPAQPVDRARPITLVHVVYNIPAEGWEKEADFYLKRLKFRLSDRLMDTGNFMRAEGSQYHHNLFIAHRVKKPSFNHIALEVASFDEVIVGGNNLLEQGWKEARRPGRHLLGSNYEWFFECPCGGRVEYIADMDRMDENWQPRIWEKHPGHSQWVIGGARQPH